VPAVREPLVVAVAQPSCVPDDVAANAVMHAATVRAAGARVVVFPELSLTGYELDAPAITVDDPRLTPIAEACVETGSVALVGAPVQGDAGRSHIGVLAVDGDGATLASCSLGPGPRQAPSLAPPSAEHNWRQRPR
jgi:predicted amidohydrolase